MSPVFKIQNNRFVLLDFARGLAAISILVFHTYQYKTYSSLYSSVDFFFVLSGFVLLPSIDRIKSRKDVFTFVRNRAVRLLPMSITTIIFVITIQMIVDLKHFIYQDYDKEGVALDPKTLIMGFLLLQIFSTKAQLLNWPLWSLSVEWISNLAIAFLPRVRNLRYLLSLLLGMALQLHSILGGIAWEMQLGRGLFAFTIGAVARKYFYERWQNSLFRTYLLVIVFFSFHAALIFWNSNLIAIAPFIFATLILNISKRHSLQLGIFLKISSFFGRYSYGLYAWHFPLLMLNSVFIKRFLEYIPPIYGWTIHIVFLATVAMSLFMTYLVIRFIEPRARHLFLEKKSITP